MIIYIPTGIISLSVAREYGEEILLGMGTLTEPEQVEMAVENGANFIVSPMFDTNLTEVFTKSGLLSMIGCFSPSEIFNA